MTDKYPMLDVLIANLPFCMKSEALQLLINKNVFFILLLPLQMTTTKASGYNIMRHVFKLIIPAPAPTFLHDGKKVMVGPVGWFIGQRGRGNINEGFQTIIILRDTTENDASDDDFDCIAYLS